MAVAVDAPLMPFRQSEPPLQIQVVPRQGGLTPTHEQPRAEARHPLGEVLPILRPVAAELLTPGREGLAPLGHRADGRVQDFGHPLEIRDLRTQLRLRGRYRLQPRVATLR